MMKESVLRVLWMEKEGEITGFHIQGHAGDAEEGENIVCAAVSAIAQCTAMGIMDVAGVQPKAIVMADGDMLFALPEELTGEQRRSVFVLMQTMRIGLDSIALDNRDIIEIVTEKLA